MNRANGVKWRRYVVVVALACVLAGLRAPAASAHIVHPGNAFSDIGLSAYKDEIVYASRLGLIAGEESGDVFRPGEPLRRADLAHWAAAFNGLAEADDAEAAGQAALTGGLVDTLEGNATYGDINRAVFRGRLTLENGGTYPADREATREQYAAFVVAFASTQVDGKRLEERAGLAAGPAGIVKAESDPDAAFGYKLTIGGRAWTLSPHPRIVHAPGDPALWDGLQLAASWISDDGEGAGLELLDFRDDSNDAIGAVSDAAGTASSASADDASAAHAHHHEMPPEQPQSDNASALRWTIALAAGLAVAGVVFAIRSFRKRK